MKPFQLVFQFARKYWGQLGLTIFAMILLIGVQLAIPYSVKLLIDAVTTRAGDDATLRYISLISIAVLGIYLVRGVLHFIRSYMAHLAGWGVVADLRKYVYDHLQRLKLRFYEDSQVGQLMSRVINDTDLFEALIAHAVPDVAVNLLTLIAVSIMLFTLNWRLALLSLIPIPLVVFSLRVYARRVLPAFKERQRRLGDLNAMLNDNLSGIREIKAFTRESTEYGRIGIGIDRYKDSNLRALKLMAIFQPFIDSPPLWARWW